MKKTIIRCLLTIASAVTLPTQAQEVTCYTVRDSAGKVLEQSTQAPVDLSKPLSQATAERYGSDSKLTIWPTDRSSCPDAASVAAASPGKRNTDTGNFGSYQASHLTSGYTSTSSYTDTSSTDSAIGRHNVRGYTRKDGTYVRPHTRATHASYSSSRSYASSGGRRR